MRKLLLACGLAICLIATAWSVHGLAFPPGPPVAAMVPGVQRIVAKPGETRITATFQIENSGGSDLVLRKATKSCDCADLDVTSTRIPPGRSARVSFAAPPPITGQSRITVTFDTNAGPRPIVAELLLIGATGPPFVEKSTPALQFGAIRSLPDVRPFFVETEEVRDSDPWIDGATCSIPGIQVRGGMIHERSSGNDVVFRRYEFNAELTKRPEAGDILGSVILHSGSAQSEEVLRLPVFGTVRRAVYAIPSVLMANLDSGESPPKLSVEISPDDPSYQLVVETDSDHPDLEIRAVPAASTPRMFEIIPRDVTKPLASKVEFRTNHPDHPIVTIPVTLRMVSK